MLQSPPTRTNKLVRVAAFLFGGSPRIRKRQDRRTLLVRAAAFLFGGSPRIKKRQDSGF